MTQAPYQIHHTCEGQMHWQMISSVEWPALRSWLYDPGGSTRLRGPISSSIQAHEEETPDRNLAAQVALMVGKLERGEGHTNLILMCFSQPFCPRQFCG